MQGVRPSIAYRIRHRALTLALVLPPLAAALGLGAAPARADEALYLSWNDCRAGVGVTGSSSPCDANTGDQRLYCAFTLAQPLDEVLGIEAVVDLQSEGITLPDWWHLEPANVSLGTPAGCRYGSLSATHDFTGETGCTGFWPSSSTAIVQGYAPGDPRGSAAQARIKATVVMPGPAVGSLDATHTYYGVKLILNNANTVGGASCGGCLTNVCVVLNAVWVKRTPGFGDRLLETPGAGNANWATWQGSAADCVAVPVRRVTWGQLKSLYR